jgi:F-type H+-transporting ATPase subunit b
MIKLDASVISAIAIFLVLVFFLNTLLFKPLMKVLAERESRTTGLVNQAQENIGHHMALLEQYQASIKNARMDGYRRQEQLRAEALKKRAEALAQSRTSAEQMILDARGAIQAQMETAKQQLSRDAQEMAKRITSAILGRPA